jgi:hypothetical protein
MTDILQHAGVRGMKWRNRKENKIAVDLGKIQKPEGNLSPYDLKQKRLKEAKVQARLDKLKGKKYDPSAQATQIASGQQVVSSILGSSAPANLNLDQYRNRPDTPSTKKRIGLYR